MPSLQFLTMRSCSGLSNWCHGIAGWAAQEEGFGDFAKHCDPATLALPCGSGEGGIMKGEL